MKRKRKSLLLILTIMMVISLILLDHMGLKKAIESCENHGSVAEVESGILSWNVSCEKK